MKNKKNLLFIDDEELNLLSLVKTFKNEYHVFIAQDINTAKEIINQEQIDLILCDLVFPTGDSIKFLQELAANKPNARVIILSGYLDEYEKQLKKLKNCLFMIQKPKTPKYYKKVVKEFLRESK